MFCSKCGTQNEDSAKYCIGCGCQLNEESKKEKKNNKVIYIVIAFIIIILIVVLAVSMGIQKKKTKEYENYMDSAQKQIEELEDQKKEADEELQKKEEQEVLEQYQEKQEQQKQEGQYQETEKWENETRVSHEDKIQYIRDIYYSTQEKADNYRKDEVKGLYTRFLDSNGKIRKIILYPSAMEFPDISDPENYVAEYYYDLTDEASERLVFAFIFNKETGDEYRYYVENGSLIRYIDEYGTTFDLTNGYIEVDTYSDAYTLYLQGERERAIAYGG